MKICLIQFLCFIAFCMKVAEAQDPCDVNNNLRLFREKYRGTLCSYRFWKDATNDRMLRPGWYIVRGIDGYLAMPVNPVPLLRCSARFPIWMNGTHPSESDGVVNRTGCVVSPNSNCEYELQIQVRNCSKFTSYYLPSAWGTDEGYCFGEGNPCSPEDPCEEYDRRDTYFSSTTCASDDGSFVCNQSSTNSWYKLLLEGNTNVEIPTTCPQQANCGSPVQLWINGSMPSFSDGMVKRELCINSNNLCCERSFNVDVKNCNDFNAYKLQNFSCPLQFCLDSQQACNSESSTTGTNELPNGSYNSSPGNVMKTYHQVAIFTIGILQAIYFYKQ